MRSSFTDIEATLTADIVLSHSLLNGNTRLSDRLLKLRGGVRLTLEHVRIALSVSALLSPRVSKAEIAVIIQVGWELGELSSSLHDHIKQGLPFKASFDAPENKALAMSFHNLDGFE